MHVTAAKFDPKKLAWMNGEYVKQLPKETFAAELRARVAAAGMTIPDGFDLPYLVDQLQIRTKFLNDIPAACTCFFTDEFAFDEKAVAKRLAKEGTKATVLDLVERFAKVEDWTAATLEAVVKELSQGQGMGPWVHPIRVAVSGRGEGIGLFEMLQLLGKEKTLTRLRAAAVKHCK